MKGKVIPCWWTENGKGAGTNSGESGARNLETESIRSGAESTGGCVKLKTVTEIKRSSARDTVIAERVYLVLNSLLDWKPVEIFKQRRDVVSFTCTFFCLFLFAFFSVWGEQNSAVRAGGFGQRRQAGQKRENCSNLCYVSTCPHMRLIIDLLFASLQKYFFPNNRTRNC